MSALSRIWRSPLRGDVSGTPAGNCRGVSSIGDLLAGNGATRGQAGDSRPSVRLAAPPPRHSSARSHLPDNVGELFGEKVAGAGFQQLRLAQLDAHSQNNATLPPNAGWIPVERARSDDRPEAQEILACSSHPCGGPALGGAVVEVFFNTVPIHACTFSQTMSGYSDTGADLASCSSHLRPLSSCPTAKVRVLDGRQ